MLIPLLFLITTTSANATDYFYCDCQAGASNECVAGNDSNTGTTSASPRKTFSNANSTFNSLAAGDSIQFCRGGAFTINASTQWVNRQCLATNVCTVTAYDLPAQQNSQLARPIITQQSDNTIFSLADGGNADHEEGYVFSNLDLRCPNCTVDGAAYGFFFYNDIDDVKISNVSFDSFYIAVRLAGSNPANPGANTRQENIVLENLKIINSKTQGILGGAFNLVISNSSFENNGSFGVFDHHIYIASGNTIVIKENDLYRSSLDANGNCNGVPLVVHGKIDDLLIQGNVIREDIGKANNTCWGIAIDTGYSKAEAFTNITIKDNKIINVGNIGIGIAACDNCVIENNIIVQGQAFGFTAISAPNRTRGADDQVLNNVTIRNNSIYMSSGSKGIVLGTEGTGHTVVSNAIHYTGTGTFTCFDLGLTASAYTAVDNNTCFFPNANAASEWEAGSGTSPSPLGAWQGQSGFGANSQNTNPEFKDPTLPLLDLSPQSISSPLVGAGHGTSSPKDYRGKTRDAQPDAGAFEFGTFNPPAKTNIYPN